jgi:NAD(P)-dependent dehydrogenase (short-subunit alcohol dehydrogenase family)
MAQKALVTGSSSGIGKGAAIALAKEGYDVAIHCSKSVAAAEEVAHSVEAMGRKAIVLVADLKDLNQLNGIFDRVFAEFGPLDVLVNNAGITKYKPFLKVTNEFFHEILYTNLRSHFFATQRAALNMIEHKTAGRIVTVTSVQQEIVLPEASIYGSFKAALFKMVKHQALELAPYGIRVNAVAPGTIKVNENPVSERERQFASRTPISRLGCPEDVAPAIVYLADKEKSSFVTGMFMMVDGGQYVPCLADNTYTPRVPPAPANL